jgi:membrane protease YdiL (CAAX protease family)
MNIFRPSPQFRQGRPWQIETPWGLQLAILCGTIMAGATAIFALLLFGKALPRMLQEALIQTAVLTTALASFALVTPRGKLASKLGLRLPRWKDLGAVILGLLIVYAWQIFSLPLWERFLRRCNCAFETRQDLLTQCSRSSAVQFLAMLAVAGVLIPVVEEIFFRRLIFGVCRPLGVPAALIAAAFIFAGAHGFLYGLPALFGLGAVFQWQYLRTGNLLTPMLTHMIYNWISLTLVFWTGQ